MTVVIPVWWRRLPVLAARPPGSRPSEPFPVVAWLVAGLVLATVPVLDELPAWMPPGMAGLALWRLLLARRGAAPPAQVVRIGLSLVVVVGLALSGRLGLGLDAALPLFVAFLWIKLLELGGGRRDLVVTAGLGLVLAATTLLVDQSLAASLSTAAGAVALLAALVRHHAPGGGGRRLWPALRTALLLCLHGLPFAIVLFLLAPRPEMPLPLSAGRRQAGVGAVMQPGAARDLANDRQVAFRALFEGPAPAADELYWRVGVLWSSDDGAVWRPPGRSARPQPGLTVQTPPGGRALPYELTVVAPMPWAPALECATSLPASTWTGGGNVLEWGQPPGGAIAYRLVSQPAARPADWGPNQERQALAVPLRLDPRVAALASSFADPRPGVAASRLLAWYQAQGFRYSLDPGDLGDDALAGFLFAARRGLCAHYAGASATLLRLAGVPARVVVGYHGGEINDQGGFLVVRQANAHAWCEWWDPLRRRWERLDATAIAPPDSPDSAAVVSRPGAAGSAAGVGLEGWEGRRRALRLWWEVQEARWDRWAMGWNAERREDLVLWLGFDQLGALGLPALLLLALGISAILVWWWGNGAPRPRRPDAAERARRRWCDCVDALAACGVPRRSGEGPRTHAERAAAQLPEEAAVLLAALAAYERLRYANAGRPGDLVLIERAAARLVAGERPGIDYSGRRWAAR